MTVEPSYRIIESREEPTGPHLSLEGMYEWLVPDTRLDAIADVWMDYLGAVSAHEDAKPELATVFGLLDALTEENECQRCHGLGHLTIPPCRGCGAHMDALTEDNG